MPVPPRTQCCSLGSSPVLDSVLGAIGGVSRAFYILHAGRQLDVGCHRGPKQQGFR